MTSQTSRISTLRRAATTVVASGALLAGGLGFGVATGWAEPAPTPGDTTTAEGAPAAPMSADQALSIIATEYDTGAGGGQISVLIHNILKLRAMGFMPSKSNADAIVAALDKRPNQAPLIKALESTLAFQQRNQARSSAAGQQGQQFNIGGGQQLGRTTIDPALGGGINVPLG